MADDLSGILESPEHTLLATVGGNTEGPLWHPDGYLTFVSPHREPVVSLGRGQRRQCTAREHRRGQRPAPFDRAGRLLMCEGADHRRVTCMDADGTVTAIAERWDGKRLHKPNDVVCRSDGSVYFTDPSLRLEPELRGVRLRRGVPR